MDFYNDWKDSMFNIEENKKFTKKFLAKAPESLEVFYNGTSEELINVCKFLLNIPISNFVYCIDKNIECKTDMIIQYSNLEHAIIDVPKVLKFKNEPLTFAQIGKIIIRAKEEGACKKYGENHSKVAAELSMVKLERKSATIVSNTAFGNFSVDLSDEDRKELVKRLAIRNEFIQKLIYLAKKDFVNYMEVAELTLSNSTALRRKSNNKQVISMILEGNEILNNIAW